MCGTDMKQEGHEWDGHMQGLNMSVPDTGQNVHKWDRYGKQRGYE